MVPRNRNGDDDLVDNILEGIPELNLGQSRPVVAGPAGVISEEVRLLQIPALTSKKSQIVTVHFTAKTENLGANPDGPITGILEFSAGGASLQRVEFDLPAPRPFGPNYATAGAQQMARRELTNGLSVSIPAAGVNAYARHDGNLRPANDATVEVGAGNTGNIIAAAFIARFPLGRVNSNFKKTVYAVVAGGANLVPAAAVAFGIPNYAVRVRFPRIPMSVPLAVSITGLVDGHSIYSIPTLSDLNLDGLPIELAPTDFTMSVRNTGAVDITQLQAVFDLEI